MATWEVEAMYFLLNIPSIYPIFILYFQEKNQIFLYNCCQKWLDTLKVTRLSTNVSLMILRSIVPELLHMDSPDLTNVPLGVLHSKSQDLPDTIFY